MRKATPADAAAMAELERENAVNWSHKHYQSLGSTAAQQPAGYLILVAEDTSNSGSAFTPVVGYLASHYVRDEWEMEYIVAAKELQRQGIATRLLNAFTDEVRALAGSRIFLEVRASNHNARALYRKLGFEQIGLRKGYYPDPLEDAILFGLIL